MGEKKGDEINTHVGQSTHQKILSQQKMWIMGVAIFSPKRERWTQKSSFKERHEVLLTKRVYAHLLEWPIACWHVFTYFTPDSNVQLSDAWKVKFISRKQNPFRFHWSLWTHLQKAKTISKDFDGVLLSAFFVAIITILNVWKWLEMFPCENYIEASICFLHATSKATIMLEFDDPNGPPSLKK